MSLPFSELNWLAVVAGAVISMAVGFVWYSRPLFGNLWMRLSGISEQQASGGPGLGYLWTFIGSLVASTTLALLIVTMGSTSLVQGALAGVLLAVGIGATATLNNAIFEQKHMGAWLINVGFQVVWLAIAGGVLAIWR